MHAAPNARLSAAKAACALHPLRWRRANGMPQLFDATPQDHRLFRQVTLDEDRAIGRPASPRWAIKVVRLQERV
jgi:hypothetical protein